MAVTYYPEAGCAGTSGTVDYQDTCAAYTGKTHFLYSDISYKTHISVVIFQIKPIVQYI